MKYSPDRLMKTVKIVSVLFFIAIFTVIILAFFGIDYSIEAMFFGTIFIVGFTIYIIVTALRTGKKYREELKSTKTPMRFKYLDTFYYYLSYYSGPDDTVRREHYAFDIIEDLSNKRLYAIAEQNTNSRFEQVMDNTKMWRIDEIDKVTTRKDWKEINYNDEGTLYIDKEIPDCFTKNDKGYILTYYGGKQKIKTGEIYNRNTNNDLSMLDKVTFITGWAEFDKK